ncbi:MAG: endonuclease/exonuclease/phosphatase family protein [Phycisphaerae bacterium]
MHRKLLAFLYAAFAVPSAYAQVDVRVATYNIENLSTTSGTQFNAAVAVLQRMCADVVTVQEIANTTVLNALAAAAGYGDAVLASTSNAIDTNPDRAGVMSIYEIVSFSTETSITLSGDPFAKDLTRNFILAEINVPGGAEDLVIIANHWKAGGTADDDEFRRSVESIRSMQAADLFASATIPYFIAGDMNDDLLDGADSPASFNSLPSGLPFSFNLGNDISFPVANGVFKALQAGTGSQNLTVVNAFQVDGSDATRKASGRRLDYLWYSDAVTVIGSEVYDSADEGLGGGLTKCGSPLSTGTSNTASDHLPVFVDIRIADDSPPPDVDINEIRIDQPGDDNDEYFELAGGVGISLDDVFYLVIGDGAGGSGVIEVVVNLTGKSLGGTGLLLAAEDGDTLGAAADLITTLNFENSDNVTHLLVEGFTGSLGDDLDTNDDGTFDVTPWANELDRIALIEEDNPPSGTDFHYGPPTVGPNGGFVPAHVYRCPDQTGGWLIGAFDPAGGQDTPGTANGCAAPGTGACCAVLTGVCESGIAENNCPSPFFEFTETLLCNQLDPQCQAAAVGACCFVDECSELAEVACDFEGGTYKGDQTTCGAVLCESVSINEIRIDQPGNDTDEYFELAGPSGASLVGITYIVLGDGIGGSGVIEAVVDLDEGIIPADGVFLAAEDGDTLGATADLLTSLNFENTDNVTHMLLLGFTGSVFQDLDTTDDGVLDIEPWTELLDCVALIDDPGGGEQVYCATTVGPDTSVNAAPGHVFRCADEWRIGQFDRVGGDDTPGFEDTADTDGDGVPDGCDLCPGFDDSLDADTDGVPDDCDACPGFDDTLDGDGDGVPDGCDICSGFDDTVDTDTDGVPDGCDLCPGFDDSVDTDTDGVPDGCDLCPGFDDTLDADGDGVPDACDVCPGFDDTVDTDADGVPDGCDNCPDVANPGQEDGDGNGTGDACEVCPALTVTADFSSRYIDVRPDISSSQAVALRVECGAEVGWVALVQQDYDDGANGLINVGVTTAACDDAEFRTPAQWLGSGDRLVVTGPMVAPDSRPAVVAVCGECGNQAAADAVCPTGSQRTWVYSDASGDGQVTFFADLFKQFGNTAGAGFAQWTGPDRGYEVDTQGQDTPDQQVTFFSDIFSAFGATAAGGSETWAGVICECP